MKLLVLGAVAAAVLAGIVVGVIVWTSASAPLGNFNPPSEANVLGQVEHYYAHNRNGDIRPAGELAGCPTREAELWFYCEFDYPSTKTTTKITCVHVYVDEPCCSWENARRYIAAVGHARAIAREESRPVCG